MILLRHPRSSENLPDPICKHWPAAAEVGAVAHAPSCSRPAGRRGQRLMQISVPNLTSQRGGP